MKNQPSILVIDDEPIICESCHRILSKENYKVDVNTNPRKGLNQALANNYDLLLLDIKMDKLDGMKLLSKFRTKNPDTPVIIITGYPSKESKEESNRLNISNYILKPFLPQEILTSVNNIVGLSNISLKEKAENSSENLPGFKSEEPDPYDFWKIGGLWRGC